MKYWLTVALMLIAGPAIACPGNLPSPVDGFSARGGTVGGFTVAGPGSTLESPLTYDCSERSDSNQDGASFPKASVIEEQWYSNRIIFAVAHAEANRYSVIEDQPTKALLMMNWDFSNSHSWSEPLRVDGWEAVRFNWRAPAGTFIAGSDIDDMNDGYDCVGFQRRARLVPGSTGYRELTLGVYCEPSDSYDIRRILALVPDDYRLSN